MVNCTLNEADIGHFPFDYYDSTGAKLTTGELVHVDGYGSLCVFTQAACRLGSLPQKANGDTFSCCQATDTVESDANMWYVPMIAFYGGILTFAFLSRCYVQAAYVNRGKQPPSDGGPVAGMRSLRLNMDGFKMWQKVVLIVIFLLTVGALVAESSIMPTSIQQTLTPTETSARVSMNAFLTPVSEVFRFLEDAMVVKVGYALAAGRMAELNMLLHVSVVGGLVCGGVAFALMAVLQADESSADALLNPSSSSNQELIDAGCSLIPTSEELLSHARVYWLLQAASWIPAFATKGVSGFLAGTGNISVYLFPMIVTAVVPIGLWFGLLPTAQSATDGLTPLSALGIAQNTGPWLVGAFFIVFLMCSKGLRQQYKLHCLCCRRGASDPTTATPRGEKKPGLCKIIAEVAAEGLELMVVDLAVQTSLTVTIYVAAVHSFATAFKLAAAQAAYWTFGPAYLIGLMLFVKVSGSQLLATGKHKAYARGFWYVVWVVSCVSVSALVSALWKHSPIAFSYGETACEFGSRPECASSYANIFMGDDSLDDVFLAFGPTIGLNMMFMLLRAGLATCHDFAFMAKASVITLIVVYIPVLLVVSHLFPDHLATGYYIAMYAPHFAMILVFGYRMRRHLIALADGTPGPWTSHMTRMSVRLSTGALHAAGIGTVAPDTAGARNSLTRPLMDAANPATGGDVEVPPQGDSTA